MILPFLDIYDRDRIAQGKDLTTSVHPFSFSKLANACQVIDDFQTNSH